MNWPWAQLLQLLSHVLAAESTKELEYEISHDLAFSYNLLRYINSASAGLKQSINSIGHALAMLGLNNLRIWASMLLIPSLSDGKPDALIRLSFCRARFLDLLARKHGNEEENNDYFILGMFSLLDALLNQSIQQAVESIALPSLVHDGLFNHASEPAIKLNAIRAIEKGAWDQLTPLLKDMDSMQITLIYTEAVQWADEQISMLDSF